MERKEVSEMTDAASKLYAEIHRSRIEALLRQDLPEGVRRQWVAVLSALDSPGVSFVTGLWVFLRALEDCESRYKK